MTPTSLHLSLVNWDKSVTHLGEDDLVCGDEAPLNTPMLSSDT